MTAPGSAAPQAAAPDTAGELGDRVAAAVARCPGVARLATGPIATYLAGRIVPGVVVHADEIRVAVVARYGTPLHETADQVRAAVGEVVPGRPVTVHIEDIVEQEVGR